jgi:hypothetical protein
MRARSTIAFAYVLKGRRCASVELQCGHGGGRRGEGEGHVCDRRLLPQELDPGQFELVPQVGLFRMQGGEGVFRVLCRLLQHRHLGNTSQVEGGHVVCELLEVADREVHCGFDVRVRQRV